jgi:hypothetical protein
MPLTSQFIPLLNLTTVQTKHLLQRYLHFSTKLLLVNKTACTHYVVMRRIHSPFSVRTWFDRIRMLEHLTFPQHLPHRWPLHSLFNRVRRGILAFMPSLICLDVTLARDILTPAEYALFRQMDVRDKQHALWVAQALLEHDPQASNTLVAAALLHDVGKCDTPFCPLERIAVHVLAHTKYFSLVVPPAYPRLSGWHGAWQCKCHHERYGAQRIRQAGGRARVAAIIAASQYATHDPEAALLARIDACF